MKTQPNVLQIRAPTCSSVRTGNTRMNGVNTADGRVRDVRGRTLIKMPIVIFIFSIVSVCVVGKELCLQ